MYCRVCGNLLDDDAHFCPMCGTKTEENESDVEFIELSQFDTKQVPPITEQSSPKMEQTSSMTAQAPQMTRQIPSNLEQPSQRHSSYPQMPASNAETFVGPIIIGVIGIVIGLVMFVIAIGREYEWNQSLSSFRAQVMILSMVGWVLMVVGGITIVSNIYKSKKTKNPNSMPVMTKMCPSCALPLKYNVRVCPRCKYNTTRGRR